METDRYSGRNMLEGWVGKSQQNLRQRRKSQLLKMVQTAADGVISCCSGVITICMCGTSLMPRHLRRSVQIVQKRTFPGISRAPGVVPGGSGLRLEKMEIWLWTRQVGKSIV